MTKGWRNESHRHSLASRGIRSRREGIASPSPSCKLSSIINPKYGWDLEEWFEDEEFELDESNLMASETLSMLEDVLNVGSKAVLSDYLKRNESLEIIDCGGKMVGYVKYKPSWEEGGIYLDELFIHPSHRNRGIGVDVLDEVASKTGAKFFTGNALDQSFEFWEKLGADLSPIVIRGKRGFILEVG